MIRNLLNKLVSGEKKSKLIINGDFQKASDCHLENVYIKVGAKAKLKIESGVKIINYSISIEEGEMIVGKDTILHQANNPMVPRIDINKGSLFIGEKNVIKADVCIRFGGIVKIGVYNCLNECTEVRCDERIEIGDFNMISYECLIYDTNTHVMYPPEERRKLTIKDFPNIGSEYERPITKAIFIGNDSWLGKRSTVLKGCIIGNNTVISTGCVVTKDIPDNHMAYGNPSQITLKKSKTQNE